MRNLRFSAKSEEAQTDALRPLDHGPIYFLTTLGVSSIARSRKPHEFPRLEGWHDPPCTSWACFTRGRSVGGRVCPAQVRVFSFVFSLVWRPPVACGAPVLCVKGVLGSLPGERGGVKGPQGLFHLFSSRLWRWEVVKGTRVKACVKGALAQR